MISQDTGTLQQAPCTQDSFSGAKRLAQAWAEDMQVWLDGAAVQVLGFGVPDCALVHGEGSGQAVTMGVAQPEVAGGVLVGLVRAVWANCLEFTLLLYACHLVLCAVTRCM